MPEQTLVVAERFHSYQGEGTYVGTPMHFIRLAGCNVGQLPTRGEVTWELGTERNFPILRTGTPAYRCHTVDGRGFWCDTDFAKGVPTSLELLLGDTWENHICISGGEPYLHRERLYPFIDMCSERRIMLHFETSGTIDWIPKRGWVTCSPKQGALSHIMRSASELKILVDKDFRVENLPQVVFDHECVYVQPVNNELSVDLDNLKLCYDILKLYPEWILSVQLHKCFGWR